MALDAKTVNAYMSKMHQIGGTGKGVYGELAALAVCESMYQKYGGLLYHSYTYKTDASLPGNIKVGGPGGFYIENLGSYTEIDILLVTPYRVFPIEVKAYAAHTIRLANERISGCNQTGKSPIHQNEMHCRHLYSSIYEALPDGKTSYVIPIVVFVDKCTLRDERTSDNKKYVYATVISRLPGLLERLNTPGKYRLDLEMMERRLKAAMVSCEKEYKLYGGAI